MGFRWIRIRNMRKKVYNILRHCLYKPSKTTQWHRMVLGSIPVTVVVQSQPKPGFVFTGESFRVARFPVKYCKRKIAKKLIIKTFENFLLRFKFGVISIPRIFVQAGFESALQQNDPSIDPDQILTDPHRRYLPQNFQIFKVKNLKSDLHCLPISDDLYCRINFLRFASTPI